MAKAQETEKVGFRGRMRQIGMVFAFTARQDKKFLPLVIVAGLIPLGASITLFILGWGWAWLLLGVMLTLMAVLIVLNLRANKAMMNAAADQPGASAQIVQNMRGDWRVTPAVA